MCENTNNIPNPNPNKKKSYKDDDLRIALVLTPLNDINLQLASQISVTGFYLFYS